MLKLTIGMATYDDYKGVWATVQGLRFYHPEAMPHCEFVVVDNNPTSKEGKNTKDLIVDWVDKGSDVSARYVPFYEQVGTAAPRDAVFREASADAVLCIDCHIFIQPGAIKRLIDYYDDHPETRDLFSGPIVYDDLKNMSSQFDDQWRSGMWGTWSMDSRAHDLDAEPFDVPAMGLGLFSCRTDAWLGFNQRFHGFGGEEHYIHEKFRQAGARCLCLPFLRWLHRFSKAGDAIPYPNRTRDRMWNYVLGHRELNMSLSRPRAHFTVDRKVPVKVWREVVAEVDQGNSVSKVPLASDNGLDALYKQARSTPSDVNEHCETLRKLASQCQHVTEFGHRPDVSTVALLAGQPRTFFAHLPETATVGMLKQNAGKTNFHVDNSGSLDIEIPETDLLFIDTEHTQTRLRMELLRHGRNVRKYIVLHDTHTFGTTGENGGPGLLPAIRSFLRIKSSWSIKSHCLNNNGLTVLARGLEARHERPERLAIHCEKILKTHNEAKQDSISSIDLKARLEWCSRCERRDGCTCTLAEKRIHRFVGLKRGACPIGYWHCSFAGDP